MPLFLAMKVHHTLVMRYPPPPKYTQAPQSTLNWKLSRVAHFTYTPEHGYSHCSALAFFIVLLQLPADLTEMLAEIKVQQLKDKCLNESYSYSK